MAQVHGEQEGGGTTTVATREDRGQARHGVKSTVRPRLVGFSQPSTTIVASRLQPLQTTAGLPFDSCHYVGPTDYHSCGHKRRVQRPRSRGRRRTRCNPIPS